MIALLSATLLAMTLAAPALAQPPHGHMLIQDPELGLVEDSLHLVGYRKCVDLAGGREVPLNAHHDNLHFGTAGEQLLERAGHVVVPTEPFGPVEDCADLAESLPLPVPED